MSTKNKGRTVQRKLNRQVKQRKLHDRLVRLVKEVRAIQRQKRATESES